MRIVDAQIHLWTNDRAPSHHRKEPLHYDEAVREMDLAGVARAINHPAVWDPDSNAYAVEAASKHPGRLATLGWFDLAREPDPAFVERFVRQPGMLGLRFILATLEGQQAFASGKLDWIWACANRLKIPVGFMLPANLYDHLAVTAARYPDVRFLVDHLGVSPFLKLPEAAKHLDALLLLAKQPNIAVKATGVPSMATDDYPLRSTHEVLLRVFEAFGPRRMFWGTDITRIELTWRQCIALFTEELPWLNGNDLELVMGSAVLDWVGWT